MSGWAMKFFQLFIILLLCSPAGAQNPSLNIFEFDSGPEYFHLKNYFYDNGEEVIVFDAQPTPALAKKSIELIQSKTKNPITWVVLLQPGAWEAEGSAAFQAIGAKVIASKKTVEALASDLVRVDSVFETTHRLELKNGQTIILKDLQKTGSSSNHTVAYIAEEEAVFVSGLVHYQVHAWLQGNSVNNRNIPTLQGWIDDLNELNKMFKRDPEVTVYGSRGKLVNLPTAVYEQTRYLKAAYPIIVNYYLANRSYWQGSNIPEKYQQEFQAEMEQAFPGVELTMLARTALKACWTCEGAEKPK
jgi:glyoxylase-like metal-dependent hydrolase (beta-lactamase superfamily II)